jgi:predicted transcriptional regulator
VEIEYKLTQAESKLMDIVWANAPMASSELIKIAARELDWKRTTTYTILKKLCEKGVAQMAESEVSALVTPGEFMAGQSRSYVDESFSGSLPLFLTAFIRGRKLSRSQADELRRLIDEHAEGAGE